MTILKCESTSLIFTSSKGVLVDTGTRYSISRYFVYRRRLPPSAIARESAYINISLLSRTALLIPVQFIHYKGASTIKKTVAREYDLRAWGPGLLVCDSWITDDMGTPHGRQVADLRDFPDEIKVYNPIEPRPPMVLADCNVNEVEGDERYIMERILRIFQPVDGRRPPVILAAAVFPDMLTISRFSL